MFGFYFIAFIKYVLAGNTLLDYTIFFLWMTIRRMTKWYISILKTYMVEEASLKFRLKKIGLMIKHNDLMREKYKKTFKYLNCVEHLLILISTVNNCVPISAFASLVCVPVGITNSAVGIKIFAKKSLELKSIRQL